MPQKQKRPVVVVFNPQLRLPTNVRKVCTLKPKAQATPATSEGYMLEQSGQLEALYPGDTIKLSEDGLAELVKSTN